MPRLSAESTEFVPLDQVNSAEFNIDLDFGPYIDRSRVGVAQGRIEQCARWMGLASLHINGSHNAQVSNTPMITGVDSHGQATGMMGQVSTRLHGLDLKEFAPVIRPSSSDQTRNGTINLDLEKLREEGQRTGGVRSVEAVTGVVNLELQAALRHLAWDVVKKSPNLQDFFGQSAAFFLTMTALQEVPSPYLMPPIIVGGNLVSQRMYQSMVNKAHRPRELRSTPFNVAGVEMHNYLRVVFSTLVNNLIAPINADQTKN